MNKIIKKVVLLTLISTFFFLSSCDELNELPLNIPIPVVFTTGGSSTSSMEEKNFCLAEYDEWLDNQEDIKSSRFISMAYWTTSATAGLTGDITIELNDGFGNSIFSITLENVAASDNIDTPYMLEVNESEIEAINTYLNSTGNNDLCFNAVLQTSNVTANTLPYSLEGRIELVIEANVEL